ncbi:MAG: hypothetical protein NT087_02170, partial [Deltaproteobacteria bacterium]|nr:hypothetical protein [Deltaproteobacteria bacterium]
QVPKVSLFFNRDSDLFNAIKTPEAEAPVSWGPSSTLLTIQFSMIAAPRKTKASHLLGKKEDNRNTGARQDVF